jgi:hypothetical protein
MSRSRIVALVCLLLGAGAMAAVLLRNAPPPGTEPASLGRDQAIRERIYAALQPVHLTGCTLKRIGEAHDGGYLMCANLLEAEAGYSYGISNYDGWGCGISTGLGVPVHQYDCFDQRVPRCEGGQTRFHAECIAASSSVDAEGRRFDSLASQITRNGDASRRLVMKMDVEGAEWRSLLATPDEVLARIDQFTIEMHANVTDAATQQRVIEKLKTHFHVAHLHFNNFGCMATYHPMPSYAWEVLFVNKRLASPTTDTSPITRPDPLDAPNNPNVADCQYAPGS